MGKRAITGIVCFVCILLSASCSKKDDGYSNLGDIGKLAPGWRGEIIATSDQSYVGLDVEIGDADNDGLNEIVAVGAPKSRLSLFKKAGGKWDSRTLTEYLAKDIPGLGLAVKVVDLNGDKRNEIVVGTGHIQGFFRKMPKNRPAILYILETDGAKIVREIASRPSFNSSRYTHGLATHDIDGDGILEIISSYCGNGEVIRYDVTKKLTRIDARKIYRVSGSGEGIQIADVDNDGKMELIVVNGFRKDAAKVEIFEFDDKGELISPPRIVIDGYGSKKYFEASIAVGDVDNNESNELIIAWKSKEKLNNGTIVSYKVGKTAVHVDTFSNEDEDLDTGFFENAMVVADADNDGKNELVVSTIGEYQSSSGVLGGGRRLGHVFMYKLFSSGKVRKELLVDFSEENVWSAWLAVGDADNDGKNEIILTTGKGDWGVMGASYVVLLEKE